MEQDQGEEELRGTPERGEALKIRSIVIPADEEQPLRQEEIGVTNLAQYQGLVGGNIEAAELHEPASNIYFNEEGKLLHLPLNRRATYLLWAHNRRFRYEDIVVGDAFIVGVVDRVGRDTDVPEEFVTRLLEARKFRTEIQTHDEPGWHGNSLRFDNWVEAYRHVLQLGQRWRRVKDVRIVPEE
jgi:Domain of unknown function (DUF3846)